MDKKKIINYLESGISLESVVKELISDENDQEFKNKVDQLLELQQYPDKKKDLELKQYILNKKFEMLDDYFKLDHYDDNYIECLGVKYLKTLQRLALKIDSFN